MAWNREKQARKTAEAMAEEKTREIYENKSSPPTAQ